MKLNSQNIIKSLREELIYIIITIIIILSYYVVYLFRSFDYTILFGWRWIHQYFNLHMIAIGFFISIFIAYLLSLIQIKLKQFQYPLLIFILSIFIIIPFWIVPEINPDTSRFFAEAKYFIL